MQLHIKTLLKKKGEELDDELPSYRGCGVKNSTFVIKLQMEKLSNGSLPGHQMIDHVQWDDYFHSCVEKKNSCEPRKNLFQVLFYSIGGTRDFFFEI